MHRQIMSSNRTRYFKNNGFLVVPSVIACLIVQTSLFSQVKSDKPENAPAEHVAPNNITIHQEINFKATPRQLYQTLLSSREFSACIKMSFPNFTETSATIDSSVGGAFSLFDGHIIGRILELVPSQRIVEAWRVVDWPAGVYSIAKFELKPQKSGTHLIFDHIGFPDGLKEHLTKGWQQHYWDALARYFH